MNEKLQPFAVGDQISLRDRSTIDVDRYIHWQNHGEWLEYDAPWEGCGDPLTAEQEQKIRTTFIKTTKAELSKPRYGGMIVYRKEDKIIGTVNRYMDKRFPSVFYIGINICEDEYLNRGLGTEALRLWVDYLFNCSKAHKIECHTWSLNPRMIHLAEKLGFKLEGQERELINWKEEWQHRLRFGLLRCEWESYAFGSLD